MRISKRNTPGLILCFVLAFFGEMNAQDFHDFSIYNYRSLGPTRGGRVTAVAGVASQPNVFFMGATGGGLWKTEDYGTTWRNVSDGYFATPSIGAISVAQNDPNIVYVGTGSDGLRSNVITGKGMYKSIDGGEHWEAIGLEKVGQIGAVEIHPTDHNTVFVAAIGQAFQPNAERGIFRTKDGGLTWEKVWYISDRTGFVDIEFMPSNPNIIYATAWHTERKPWTIISGGEENGIYKSLDGGDTWKKMDDGLPKIKGKIDLAVSKDDSKVLYALVEAKGDSTGLYRSDDQGRTFKQVSNKSSLLNRAFYYTNVEADPNDVNHIHVLETSYWESFDGGKTWNYKRTPHSDNHDIWINPNNSDIQVQGNDGGANVTINGGKTWSTQYNQSTAELYQVEVDNQYPYWLYGGQQDNYTTISVPSSPPRGHQAGAIGLIMNTGGCETGPAVPNPVNSNIVYSNCKGMFSVYNKATGQEQRYDVGAAYMYGHNPKNLKFRFQRVSPIHVSPHDQGVVYHTSQFVHRTRDEGKTWEIISPDLTAFEPDKQVFSGSPITTDITGEEFYSTIYAIRESSLTKGQIWVGANDGPIHVTVDDGANWQNVTPSRLPKGGRVDCVEPSHHNNQKAFVTVLRYQLGDWKPYIFRTDNLGKSWKLITNGIPSDYPVRVLREHPEKEGLLFAGTEFGVFVSFDDGDHWQKFQQNLPVTPITDMKIHRNDLVLSTMGRGFYVLDNISALTQDYASLDRKSPKLFDTKNTIRYRHGGVGNMGMNVGAPEYPRQTVDITYYLPEKVKGGIQLRIMDSQGKLVKAFTTDTIVNKSSATRDMSTNNVTYLFHRQLTNKKGLHTFQWDMRHDGAWDKSEGRRFQYGPMVAPGTYQIELLVGDKTLMHQFDLLADPKVLASGISQSDMEAQEALSLKVTDLLSRAKIKANEVEMALKKLGKSASSEKVKLTKLKDALIRKQGRYTETKYINQVQYLLGILQRADQLPGKDAYDRYEELEATFRTLVGE